MLSSLLPKLPQLPTRQRPCGKSQAGAGDDHTRRAWHGLQHHPSGATAPPWRAFNAVLCACGSVCVTERCYCPRRSKMKCAELKLSTSCSPWARGWCQMALEVHSKVWCWDFLYPYSHQGSHSQKQYWKLIREKVISALIL